MSFVQTTIENTKNIFDEKGEVSFGGWSRTPLFVYNKESYQPQNKLVERDSYYISNDRMGFYISVETVSNEVSIKLALADFERSEIVRDYINRKVWLEALPSLPESGKLGEFSYSDKRIALALTNTVEGRYIKCDFIDFNNFKNLYVKVLVKKTDGESMNTVVPFNDNPKCFFMKRFVPKFVASGVVRIGGEDYSLDEESSSVYFDWSRFVLPRRQQYQTLAGSVIIDGHRFAVNLASKVGNNSKGSENCYFIDNKLYKVGRLKVSGNDKSTDGEWLFHTAKGALDLRFVPDRHDGKTLSCKCDKTTIVFGKLYGIIDDIDGTLELDGERAHMIFGNL